jgi:hypothetical protein
MHGVRPAVPWNPPMIALRQFSQKLPALEQVSNLDTSSTTTVRHVVDEAAPRFHHTGFLRASSFSHEKWC